MFLFVFKFEALLCFFISLMCVYNKCAHALFIVFKTDIGRINQKLIKVVTYRIREGSKTKDVPFWLWKDIHVLYNLNREKGGKRERQRE